MANTSFSYLQYNCIPSYISEKGSKGYIKMQLKGRHATMREGGMSRVGLQ